MAEVYDQGDVARIEVAFQAAGAMADPTSVTLELIAPDGTTSTYTYAAGEIEKVAVGRYRRDQDLTGAAVGLWRYRWIATGDVGVVVRGEFTVRDDPVLVMVRAVRDRLRDRPERSVLTAELSATATTATIPEGDVARLFGRTGVTVEFDDAAGESAIVTGADGETSTLTLLRGQHGSTAAPHAQGTALLVEPRFSWREIASALGEAVDLHLWPHVWRHGEFVLTVQPGTGYYSPPVPDIEEVTYAYQISGGRMLGVPVTFLGPGQADEANFPYGAILVPWVADSSSVYVAYRARPRLRSLSSELERLAIVFALSQLAMQEESSLLAPGSSVVDRQLQAGSRLRQGVVMREVFERSRAEIRASLLVAEDEAKRRANPRRWA